ncbi:MAG: type II secretion system major pseudopilin GspG [Deltaproteobacteria bacterium]|nr:type II secretion system major pseudopilin GspG [Deltaproteobacteria bacterium]
MSPRKSTNNEGGFTLIEIMVVVVILGILAAVIAPRFMGRADDARVTEVKLQIKNFETGLKMYKLDNARYPTTEQGMEALITKPSIAPMPAKYRDGGYLEGSKIPKDPWHNTYLYFSPGTHGDYDIVSYGADGVRGGEKYDADIESWNIN